MNTLAAAEYGTLKMVISGKFHVIYILPQSKIVLKKER